MAVITGAGTVDFEGSFTPGGGATGMSHAAQLNLSEPVRLGANPSPFILGTMAPQTTTTFAGDLVLGQNSQLNLNVAGTTPGTDYDRIMVSGHLTLGGTLNVTLGNGFSPTAGQSFALLAANTFTGTFSSLDLPALADGLSWDTSALNNGGILAVVPEPSVWVTVALGGGLCALGVARRRVS